MMVVRRIADDDIKHTVHPLEYIANAEHDVADAEAATVVFSVFNRSRVNIDSDAGTELSSQDQ